MKVFKEVINKIVTESQVKGSITTDELMDKMDKKGVMLNSAFAVSAAFMFAAHLAYTMAFDSSMLIPVMVGKTVSGVSALLLAFLLSRKFENVS